MPAVAAFLRSVPTQNFAGAVFRVCPARYARNSLSMRGSFRHGARYNIRAYFGALYTSLNLETAHSEIARYWTLPPREGFVVAVIQLRLSRVVDLTSGFRLRKADIDPRELTGTRHLLPQELGRQAWESGLEALLVRSAAVPGARNLVLFLDNQAPGWRIELRRLG